MVRTNFEFVFLSTLILSATLCSFFTGKFYDHAPLTFAILFIVVVAGTLVLTVIFFYSRKRSFENVLSQIKAVTINPKGVEIQPTENEDFDEIFKAIQQLQKELNKGEEQRNRMIADVAHELRTPLSILKGQLETIIEGAAPLTKENLYPLLDETTRMSKLIQDLRQLSLAESGHLKLVRSWVRFDQLIDEITAFLQVEAEEKSIDLQIIGNSDCEVYCDVPRLKQVFINLIGNAIRYTDLNGKVQVQIEKRNDKIHIFITDSGQGIPHEYLPYIFQRFVRVEQSRNRNYGGMGLGLAIAKEFIVAHGGDISVDSEVGVGTMFSIQLPIFPIS